MSLRRFRRHSRASAPSARRFRPCLEPLEWRELLSTLTVLNLNDSGPGSLRQLIANANPGDTINFAVTGKITLTSGPLAVNQSLTIAGPGAGALTVSGNNASQVFNVGDVNFSLSGITVADGSVTSESGGGIVMSGDPGTTLSLTSCVFTNNHAGGVFNGGAVEIFGDGTMNVTDCLFSNNSSAVNGGAIDSPGINLTVTGSTFSANSAGNGGAISIGNDSVSVTNSTFVGNTASDHAGAVFSDFNADYTFANCTLTNNTAGGPGGGFSIIGGSLTLQNTIVAGNTAVTGPDISGGFFSQGNNLIGETDGSSGATGSDITGTIANPVNPLLSPLGNFGGLTPTVALLQGSPALGHGNTGAAPPTDQRGDPRGGPSDVGAVQLLDAVVTNTNDSGPGSLRQAILDTNAHPGNDTITFDIPGGGVQTIRPTTPLPAVTDTVVIDGYTQPGSSANTLAVGDNAVIDVRIDGGGMNADGLVLSGVKNSVIRGLSITGFGTASVDHAAINVQGQPADNNLIAGNFLGVLPDGTTPAGNTDGVIVTGNGNVIGGTNPADRNLLSGNFSWGFVVEASNNTVEGNYIGLDASGTSAVANGNGGVIDQLSNGNVIGGTTAAARNYIAGNVGRGIKLTVDHTSDANTSGSTPMNNVVEGNWIGLNVNGVAVGGQVVAGVELRNVIANQVGVSGAGDVISGNGGPGVSVFGSGAIGNSISGNLVGTDPTGAAAAGNGSFGVVIDGGALGTTVSGNVVSGNANTGVLLQAAAGPTTIQGNLIGLNAAGTAALGNGVHGVQVLTSAAVTIGGDTAAARNVISGNNSHGVALNGGNTTVIGNYIGTDATGTRAIGNGASGIGLNNASGNTIGDTTAGGGNVISGNAASGIEFFNGSNANTVVHNLIGTAADGVSPLGNGRDGVRFLFSPRAATSIFNTIGTLQASGGNVIAFNPNGVVVDTGSVGNTISGNSIFANAGLGILLNGGNDSIAAPVLTAIGSASVSGTLSGTPSSTYRIEIYASPAGGPAGQGKTLVGILSATTDSSGNGSFSGATSALPPGQLISATATAITDPFAGDTSQFSGYGVAPLPLAGFQVIPATPSTTAGQPLSFTVAAVDTTGHVLTNYQGTVVFASAGTDAGPSLPGSYTFTAADGGVHTFSVTYSLVGAQTLRVTDVVSGASGTAAVTVVAGAFNHLGISGLSNTTPIGVENVVTVTALDAFGNLVTGFNDLLDFSSNDTAAQIPHGKVQMVNGVAVVDVTFRTLVTPTLMGGQTVRVYTLTATVDSSDPLNAGVSLTQSVVVQEYLLPAPVQFVEVENVPFTNQLVATFQSDLSLQSGTTLFSAAGFSATIDWGDNTPLDTGTVVLDPDGHTYDVFGSHTYPTGQTDYPVDVTITFQGFSSEPVTPSVAAVLTGDQFANLVPGSAVVTRAVGGQTSLDISTDAATASLDGASAGLKSTLFVASYANNPQPGAPVNGLSFYDVRATNPTDGAQLVVTFRFPPGGARELEYFDPSQGKYVPVVGSTRFSAIQFNADGSITVVFDATSFPRLSALQGSVFTIVVPPPPATTQSAVIGAQLALADRTGGTGEARDISFQASGLSVGLSPSQAATKAAARADLGGGGGDDDPSDEDMDFFMQVLGFAGADGAPVIAPAVAPARPGAPGAVSPDPAPGGAAPQPTPGGNAPPATPGEAGPEAALPPAHAADAVFAAAVAAPFNFPAPAPQPKQARPARPGNLPDPSLLAVPLLGALAARPAEPRRARKRRGATGGFPW